GKRIIKNAQLREEFESSAAYSVLFMELATDADKLAAFVNGAIPGDALEKFAKEQEAKGMVTETEVAEITKPVQVITRADLKELDMAEVMDKIQSGEWKLAEQ